MRPRDVDRGLHVPATRALPGSDQGLATGLITLTLQVSSTIGAPILNAIAASRSILLSGTHLAIIVSVTVIVTIASFIGSDCGPRLQPAVTDAYRRADSRPPGRARAL
jgi:hypothetical protein